MIIYGNVKNEQKHGIDKIYINNAKSNLKIFYFQFCRPYAHRLSSQQCHNRQHFIYLNSTSLKWIQIKYYIMCKRNI